MQIILDHKYLEKLRSLGLIVNPDFFEFLESYLAIDLDTFKPIPNGLAIFKPIATPGNFIPGYQLEIILDREKIAYYSPVLIIYFQDEQWFILAKDSLYNKENYHDVVYSFASEAELVDYIITYFFSYDSPISINNLIKKYRDGLEQYLVEAYGHYFEYADGCSYEYNIKALCGIVFDWGLLSSLSYDLMEDILFFIAHLEECCVLAWLSPRAPLLSHAGNLTKEDFIVLCKKVIEREKEDSCDYQLASCFEKFEILTSEDIIILTKLFNKKNSYTKRSVLRALAKYNYPNIESYISQLLVEGDEWDQLYCLKLLKTYQLSPELYQSYFYLLQRSTDINIQNAIQQLI